MLLNFQIEVIKFQFFFVELQWFTCKFAKIMCDSYIYTTTIYS